MRKMGGGERDGVGLPRRAGVRRCRACCCACWACLHACMPACPDCLVAANLLSLPCCACPPTVSHLTGGRRHVPGGGRLPTLPAARLAVGCGGAAGGGAGCRLGGGDSCCRRVGCWGVGEGAGSWTIRPSQASTRAAFAALDVPLAMQLQALHPSFNDSKEQALHESLQPRFSHQPCCFYFRVQVATRTTPTWRWRCSCRQRRRRGCGRSRSGATRRRRGSKRSSGGPRCRSNSSSGCCPASGGPLLATQAAALAAGARRTRRAPATARVPLCDDASPCWRLRGAVRCAAPWCECSCACISSGSTKPAPRHVSEFTGSLGEYHGAAWVGIERERQE